MFRMRRSSSAMSDVALYRQYASDCAKLARSMPEHRARLMDMAAAWNALADAAEKRKQDSTASEQAS